MTTKTTYDCSTDFCHDLRIDVRDPLHPRFTCSICNLSFPADSLLALTTFLTEPHLFNYGISLYGGFMQRDLAWEVIDAGVEIALLKLPPDQLDRLKQLSKEAREDTTIRPEGMVAVDEDLTKYKFKDRQAITRDLSIFHWHTWRVVRKLLERDGFYRGQEEKEKEVQLQPENGTGLHGL